MYLEAPQRPHPYDDECRKHMLRHQRDDRGQGDPEKYPATSRMAEKLSRPAGRAAYAERTWLSEAPNGWIKHVLGFRRFSLRGLAKVQGEWDLVCLALNTKRLHALMAA